MVSKQHILLAALAILASFFIGRSGIDLSPAAILGNPSPTPSIYIEEDGTVLVTAVVDGDTIEIEGGQRVRLIGVNTPETVDPRRAVQCFGKEASAYTKSLIEGKRVRLEKDVSEVDKYGRLLRYVYLPDGTFINLKLVQGGYAQASAYPPDTAHKDAFQTAQTEAKEAQRGLWGSCQSSSTSSSPQTSAAAQNDGACTIKGNISSGGKIYHLPGCTYYEKTVITESAGERWFCSESEAQSAGWRRAANC